MRTARLATAAAVTAAVTVAPAALAATGSAPVPGWRPRPATYGVVAQHDVPVTMSDGVVLDTDVYRPARNDGTPAPGRFPVVVSQTPYNKNAESFADPYLVQRGYVQVVADVRGTGSSGGTWDSFGSREQRDGYELVEWAASRARPWSDGRVATYGASYAAINQLLTAAQHPAGLKATFPIVPGGDVYRDVTASGGQIDAGFIPLWLGLVTATAVVPPAYTAQNPVRALGVLTSHVGGAMAFQGPQVLSGMAGDDGAYDGPFYRERSPLEVIDKVDVPTFVVGGWHDLFQRSEPLIYQALRRRGVPTRLLMGPWTHVQGAMGAGLPAQGVPSLDELALRWFDHYVRGVPDPGLDRDVKPVTYYDLGTKRWTTADGWLDPHRVSAHAFRLSGTAQPGAPGALTAGPAAAGADPVLPVPTQGLCSRSASQWTAGLVMAGTPCESDARYDDATATSYDLPVTKPMTLFGPVAAHLWVSTTAKDGMVAVRVEDVAPDGSVDALTGGWQVLSLRKLDARRSVRLDGRIVQPYHPFTRASVERVGATPMEVWVEVFPTGATLLPGHHLRLTLEAFDTPHLAPPLPQAASSAGGVLTIYHDARHPSELVVTTRDR